VFGVEHYKLYTILKKRVTLPLSRRSIGAMEKHWEARNMRRNLALAHGLRGATPKAPRSLACIAFVAVIGVAFWAGAIWIGETLLRLATGGF